VDALAEEIARTLAGVDYEVRDGDTIATVAKRFGASARALQQANRLRIPILRTGQRLKVPRPAGCTLTVPSSLEAQMLAGAIFAEASPRAQSNDEREAIAWAFVNSARHVQRLCNGELECPGASETRMRDRCTIDRQSLGLTIAESIQRGSVAYNGPRWQLVMTGDVLLPAGNLCTLPSGETPEIARAIKAAEASSAAARHRATTCASTARPTRRPTPRGRRGPASTRATPYLPLQAGSECG
jgi:LysM repeat protein